MSYKAISDYMNKSAYEDLLNNKNSMTGSRPTIPSTPAPPSVSTDPVGPTNPTEPENPGILPEYLPIYQQNNDMVGWTHIPGTSIDYPVVQSPYQKNYYLRRNFQKKSATCGTIYVREECDVNKPSDSVLLYGHNMQNGTMFHDLINYKKRSFWEQNRYIYFDTLTEYHTYEIVAVFTTTADPAVGFRYHLFTDGTEQAYDKFVSTCKELSFYDTGITPEYGQKLLTLSTCDKTIGYGQDGRLVVVARRIL
jgi:sortase B